MRKGNLVGHIQKQHLTLDQVPYWCALCSLRCRTKEELIDHVNNYGRHLDEEEKLPRLPNYAEIFRKSEDPYVVGDDDMVALTKEQTRVWRRQQAIRVLEGGANNAEEEEEDGDEDSDPKNVPGWAIGVTGSRTKPTQSGKPPGKQDLSKPALMTPVATPLANQKALAAATAPAVTTATAVPLNAMLSMPEMFGTINADDWASTYSLTGGDSAANPGPMPIQVSTGINLHRPATCNNTPLRTPVMTVNTPHQEVPRHPIATIPASTPCQDENILPDLLGQEGIGNLCEELGIKETPEETEEPIPKRQRKETTMPQLDAITKAIVDGFSKVAKALDDNTRAIRCQEKTSAKAVDELKRIERRLTQMDRTLAEKADERPRRPALQSVVNRMN